MAKISVGVVMGGISLEHDVSLSSGCGMLSKLDGELFSAFPILIGKNNTWTWPEIKEKWSGSLSPEQAKSILESGQPDWSRCAFPLFSSFPSCGIFLLALHGEGGEDGRLQGFLELAGQAYTGSGPLGSAHSMDKISSKKFYSLHGIQTPKYEVLEGNRDCSDLCEGIEREFGFPVVVKNPTGGSSLGMGIAKNREELTNLLRELGLTSKKLLIEQFIKGHEASCGYLQNGPVLPPTEIRPVTESFFSYEAKYQAGKTEEITPASFAPEMNSEMQSLAARCHKALGLSVYSRTDILHSKGELYVLETNNLPGFTPTSLLPQQAAHMGMNYTQLLTHVIGESLKSFNKAIS